MLKENLKNVQNNIKKACERVGRKPEEVTLVAVSKMKPLSDIEELLETGQSLSRLWINGLLGGVPELL